MSHIIIDEKRINNLLERGVEDIFVKENLKKKLMSGKQLRIKLGFDPTGSKIHIGRAIVLRKLREFQDLGHKIFFIVGDFTAQVGDPSDKLEKRPMLKKEQIKENLKTYKKQVGKIIDLKKVKFCYNSKWLKKLDFQEISELAESFSVQQMSARRNFKDRIEKGDEVSLREFLYPLMQGYDSVAIKADVEIGGFDQLFNLKAGRVIQKHYGQNEQDVLTCQMLEGTDGRKMSTSWGNIVTIVDESNDMFGKLMAVHDSLITKYFKLCTDTDLSEILKMDNDIKEGKVNPRDLKMKLAYEIVKIYHGEKKAKEAEENFIKTFQKKEIPDNLEEIKADHGLGNTLVINKIVSSMSEYRRLIEEGAIKKLSDNKEAKITDTKAEADKGIYKVGKRRFVKII
ncbi:MAG TPA: tyrosine--tRNA ligase [Candidatus Paceibacterota bacterium]|nr:tyrosine--tRNA ligase [Candidatus Paceibacterota bacterium]HPT17997.1 tyrosine--tRNA ligase [Candidatus Paceibacterota bacterium]